MKIFFRVASGTFLRTYVGLYVGDLLTDMNKQLYKTLSLLPTGIKLFQMIFGCNIHLISSPRKVHRGNN